MELQDLVGEHWLDAVDFSHEEVATWGDRFESCEMEVVERSLAMARFSRVRESAYPLVASASNDLRSADIGR